MANVSNEDTPSPVVGIGASAGGLEAFSELLGHLSQNTVVLTLNA
jgi:chemotaxis response regulator CheB